MAQILRSQRENKEGFIFMKKLFFLPIMVTPILFTACSTTKSVTKIGEPGYENLRTNDIGLNKTSFEMKKFLGQSPEIQCFGDLQATYEEWDTEPGNPMNNKYNITFLPVTNQTALPHKDLPQDISLMAQAIAAQLGIGYNIVFSPSLSDVPNSLYADFYSTQLVGRAGASTSNILADYSSNISNKNITIISAITEYDVNYGNSPSGNIQALGTTDGKSFSIGASHGTDKIYGRIAMVFNTAYFAKTGDYATPQLIYNPNTTSKVSIDFVDDTKTNELSLSYNGGKPTISTKYKTTNLDSRYIALNLLIERGLLETLGKYHRIPYWRCMEQNQKERVDKDGNKQSPLGQVPLSLTEARKLPGYNPDVEAHVRRMYRYKGNTLGLGPYTYREEYIERNQEVVIVSLTNKTNPEPFGFKPNDNLYPLIVSAGSYQRYDLNSCAKMPEILSRNETLKEMDSHLLIANDLEKPSLQSARNALQKEVQMLDSQCKIAKIQQFNVDFSSILQEKFGDKLVVPRGRTSTTGYHFLTVLSDMIQSNYANDKNLIGGSKNGQEYLAFLENIKDSEDSLEDKFVSLWLSAPYLKDARIYPYHINNQFGSGVGK